MLAHATIDKLSVLRLPAFAEAFQRQLGNPEFADLSFEDRVGLLVDAEWTHREQRKLRRRLRQANLRRQASLEDSTGTAHAAGSTRPSCSPSARVPGSRSTATCS